MEENIAVESIEKPVAGQLSVRIGAHRMETVDRLAHLTNQGDRSDFVRALFDQLGKISEPFDIRHLKVAPRRSKA